MKMRIGCFLAIAAACVAGGASAAQDRWTLGFGQGVAEYAVGSFADGASHLSLSCSEAGLEPGSVSIWLVRAGYAPGRPTPATFATDAGEVAVTLDADGWAKYPSLTAAPEFARLWRLLGSAKTLRVSYGPGAAMTFPVAEAGDLFGGAACPKQLAR